ncbi:KDO2-lipid IV(A) lauroyltransferase [Litoreibacter ascidiaceicola]|uniref:KDO2-lipid IV(A) lauroyltransferase n=1 Tax=Litoreibacter ascidiaceicola TaxID=1486859 RepID=A0A1M4UVH0_9RHOB|nr:lysophospholipid acyltransferase family protein [Litoreibacter ascidiaceicola]SHE60590.1 KDO2-lipid IV(A) lauroyltransferase [Litoreibacter ascidiaceicola]
MALGSTATARRGVGEFVSYLAIRGVIGVALALPYRWRVPLAGWIVSRIVAPLAGYSKRVRENLAYVCPDMPQAEVDRLARAVPDNAGRTLIEIYSGKGFTDRFKHAPLTGEGVAALRQAHADGRPVVLVTGHFGNYDAPRAALIAAGFNVGALYREMNNGFFNPHYVAAISKVGTPVFPRGRQGLAGLIKFLRGGGMAGFLVDQYMWDGEDLTFFGKPAPTALSAADLALKYNALVIPVYGIRQPNGLDFEVVCEAPIPHSTPVEMTQALNDSLEALVRQHMDQWFWIHRRWKPEQAEVRQSTRAAAKMGPDDPS